MRPNNNPSTIPRTDPDNQGNPEPQETVDKTPSKETQERAKVRELAREKDKTSRDRKELKDKVENEIQVSPEDRKAIEEMLHIEKEMAAQVKQMARLCKNTESIVTLVVGGNREPAVLAKFKMITEEMASMNGLEGSQKAYEKALNTLSPEIVQKFEEKGGTSQWDKLKGSLGVAALPSVIVLLISEQPNPKGRAWASLKTGFFTTVVAYCLIQEFGGKTGSTWVKNILMSSGKILVDVSSGTIDHLDDGMTDLLNWKNDRFLQDGSRKEKREVFLNNRFLVYRLKHYPSKIKSIISRYRREETLTDADAVIAAEFVHKIKDIKTSTVSIDNGSLGTPNERKGYIVSKASGEMEKIFRGVPAYDEAYKKAEDTSVSLMYSENTVLIDGKPVNKEAVQSSLDESLEMLYLEFDDEKRDEKSVNSKLKNWIDSVKDGKRMETRHRKRTLTGLMLKTWFGITIGMNLAYWTRKLIGGGVSWFSNLKKERKRAKEKKGADAKMKKEKQNKFIDRYRFAKIKISGKSISIENPKDKKGTDWKKKNTFKGQADYLNLCQFIRSNKIRLSKKDYTSLSKLLFKNKKWNIYAGKKKTERHRMLQKDLDIHSEKGAHHWVNFWKKPSKEASQSIIQIKSVKSTNVICDFNKGPSKVALALQKEFTPTELKTYFTSREGKDWLDQSAAKWKSWSQHPQIVKKGSSYQWSDIDVEKFKNLVLKP